MFRCREHILLHFLGMLRSGNIFFYISSECCVAGNIFFYISSEFCVAGNIFFYISSEHSVAGNVFSNIFYQYSCIGVVLSDIPSEYSSIGSVQCTYCMYYISCTYSCMVDVVSMFSNLCFEYFSMRRSFSQISSKYSIKLAVFPDISSEFYVNVSKIRSLSKYVGFQKTSPLKYVRKYLKNATSLIKLVNVLKIHPPSLFQ